MASRLADHQVSTASVSLLLRRDALVALYALLEVGFLGEALGEVEVALVLLRQQVPRVEAVGVEERALRLDLGIGDAAEEVRSDVVGLGRRRVVGVPADVEVVVVLAQLLARAGETAHDKLVKSWLARYPARRSEVLRLADAVKVESNDFAIEDLLEEEFYLAGVREVYGQQLAAAGVEKLELVGGAQLGKRVERALDAIGVQFNKGSVAKRIRRDLSCMKDLGDLPEETQTRARTLMSALTASLATVSG